jgi:excisionase family DNA binding protein
MVKSRRSVATVSEGKASQARSAVKALAKIRRSTVSFRIQPEGGKATDVTVPGTAFRLFLEVLDEMAQGHPVSILPAQEEVTTQQAADILKVSRPYLVGLLDQKKIPSRRVGNRRKVRVSDLMAFKRIDDAERDAAADELTAEAQRLGLGY